MKRLLKLTVFIKGFLAWDKNEPPYPLTYDEWEGIQQDCLKWEDNAVMAKLLTQAQMLTAPRG
jgi:hypothetical protein